MTYEVRFDGTWEGFRTHCRGLLAHRVDPAMVRFTVEGVDPPGLFAGRPPPEAAEGPSLPRRFFEHARNASAFDAPDRWELVYRVAYRCLGDRGLLSDLGDDDILVLTRRAKHVARDIHKVHAFVRFRPDHDAHGPVWVAFHRPDHWVVEHATPHFAKRFGDMRFLLATPKGTALHVPGEGLTFGPPSSDPGVPLGEFEGLWNTYYANIYNPQRTMVDAMLAEMPKKHWATMPETQQIPRLLRERAARTQVSRSGIELAADVDLAGIAARVRGCDACPLADPGLRGVPGEGPANAAIALVGEQPGDHEDRAGRPFVGPAGQLLMQALAEVGLERDQVYLTNAVKHFKHRLQGTRRIHESPERYVVEVCRTFVFRELELVRPRVTVALGATAALSLLGKVSGVDRLAGQVLRGRFGPLVVAPHPAAILRRPERSIEDLVGALRLAQAVAAAVPG